MKKLVAIILIAAALTTSVAGCAKTQKQPETTKQPETQKETESNNPIRFGTLPAESAIPIILAKEKGFFDKEGAKVELTPFNSPNDRNVAVQAGKLDGIIADTMTSLTFHEGGFKMKITSDINEDFKLLTSPKSGIDTFQKLNDKDVSIVPNFVLEYIMDKMAEKNNIKYKVVSIPSIPARYEALLSDKISAVVFTEPQATVLASKGAKVLATSKEYGLKAGTILFDEKVLTDNSKGIKSFYKAYNDAVDYINKTDVSEYGQILTKYGFPEEVTKYLSSGVKYSKAGKITDDTFKSVLAWCKTKGMVTKDYKFEDISNFKFIE